MSPTITLHCTLAKVNIDNLVTFILQENTGLKAWKTVEFKVGCIYNRVGMISNCQVLLWPHWSWRVGECVWPVVMRLGLVLPLTLPLPRHWPMLCHSLAMCSPAHGHRCSTVTTLTCSHTTLCQLTTSQLIWKSLNTWVSKMCLLWWMIGNQCK